ncbi:MAG: M15 family metallopeptidase [Gemmatimonadaceae bacterium]|nr:M15 family metallopeptidase [Gemmatimonadaceae bacterium]
MNIMSAVNRPAPEPNRNESPRAPRAADSRRADGRRSDVRRTDDTTEREEPAARKIRSKSPEFSALLALLAGAGSQVRADLLQQLPEESASLVDRLLEEAAGSTPVEAVSLFDGAESAAQTGMIETDQAGMATDATATTDAMRYGLLQQQGTSEQSTETTAEPASGSAERSANRSKDVVDLNAYAQSRNARRGDDATTRALEGIARAAGQIGAMDNDRALDVLARVASKRGSSLEQLLALGDTRGANTRAQLDALIAKAGTPEGARLATQALLNEAAGLDITSTTGTSPNIAAPAVDAVSRRAQAQAHAHGVLSANAAVEDVTMADRSLEGVSPELRAKVERVVERMKNEYGHDVDIVETTRSQERQDWLFAQGRTRTGPVVTWTRDSAHTRGEAVDVIIDGSWDNAQGFARLQRIAREEGLRTLGMKDPGHLELPGAGAPVDRNAEVRAKVESRIPRENTSSERGVASVANVAGVAGVARVADSSATTATARTAGNGEGLTASAAFGNTAHTHNEQQNSGNAFGRGERDSSGKPLNDGKALGRESRDADQSAIGTFGASASAPGHTGVTGTERAAQVNATSGSNQAERVSDIQQMRDDAPATPLTRMTLNVDNANGTQEKVTIDVRGNTVNTQITTDAPTADRIRMRTADLQDALGRHGLESDRVRISTTKSQDGTDTARAVSGERDALKIGNAPQTTAQDQSAGNGQRERTPARDYQDDARREQSNRARDERQQRQDAPRPEFNLFGIES